MAFDSSSPLGALGRRFESCRPDSYNPSHTSELPRLAFLFLICLKISTGEEWARICISLDNFGDCVARHRKQKLLNNFDSKMNPISFLISNSSFMEEDFYI